MIQSAHHRPSSGRLFEQDARHVVGGEIALPAEDALTMAVAVGACCVEAPDATSGIRPWDEIVGRVKSGWRRAPSTVPEGGWSRGPDGTWHGPNDRG